MGKHRFPMTTIRLDPEFKERVQKVAEEKEVTFQELTIIALTQYLDVYNALKESQKPKLEFTKEVKPATPAKNRKSRRQVFEDIVSPG